MIENLKKIAFERRLDVLEMVKAANSGHIGGDMSCMDILVALYYKIMDTKKIIAAAPDRDRFVLSKGHCAEALYAVLADRGVISKSSLKSFASFGTLLAGHPMRKLPGIEAATGALGHGLSLGVGMSIGLTCSECECSSHVAHANRSNSAKIYVLMGDGELAEGSVWEAFMSASKYKLDNLCAIIDRNRLQISGDTKEVMPLENLSEKFRTFGWECRICDGHEPDEIIKALTKDRPPSRPLAVIANTIKGFGSPIMENKAEWHHRIPDDIEFEQIKKDLAERRDNCG
ncbi:MAG: transketolase [Oscillospiraceae bacterium]|nr:transketolase [Oscillospiraceae bacterium]